MRIGFKQAVNAKKAGLSPGICDLMIPRNPAAGRPFNIWVEMKRTKGGVVSPEQKDWHRYLQDHSEDVVIVALGCEEAIKKISEYLK